MLWDCPRCGTTKLHGVDHRHCPNWGAGPSATLIHFEAEEGEAHACPFPQPRWEAIEAGIALARGVSRRRAELNCESLESLN
ncbi:MAG: hypothetical protein HC927_01010 [Deltaproteobacteria bacterium]|nr:hypothetical protein [Deltaproteobacteria bacterium]